MGATLVQWPNLVPMNRPDGARTALERRGQRAPAPAGAGGHHRPRDRARTRSRARDHHAQAQAARAGARRLAGKPRDAAAHRGDKSGEPDDRARQSAGTPEDLHARARPGTLPEAERRQPARRRPARSRHAGAPHGATLAARVAGVRGRVRGRARGSDRGAGRGCPREGRRSGGSAGAGDVQGFPLRHQTIRGPALTAHRAGGQALWTQTGWGQTGWGQIGGASSALQRIGRAGRRARPADARGRRRARPATANAKRWASAGYLWSDQLSG
jgi:hypothetical protein